MSISLPTAASAGRQPYTPAPSVAPRKVDGQSHADPPGGSVHRISSPRRTELAAMVVYGENAQLQQHTRGRNLDLFA